MYSFINFLLFFCNNSCKIYSSCFRITIPSLFIWFCFNKSEILFDLAQCLLNKWLILLHTCFVTWLGGLIVDLKVTSHLRSSWETMKNQLQWRERPKEGNEFSWLQVGVVLKQGESNFSLKNGAGEWSSGRP